MNTIGSWQNHAISLGLPPNTPVKKQIDEFIRRWDNFPVTPERRANPAWAEILLMAMISTCSIFCRCSASTMVTAVSTSIKPVSFRAIRWIKITSVSKTSVSNRMEVKGKRKLGLQPVPMHDIALHLHKAEERGEDLPIAITLGNDPIITLMGATPLKIRSV
ncbi:hydroxyaromatic non-oxidative decarboxylase protein C [Klebsiella pneumoniae]|uniref:Hydroxyaromatic non-oxidative decarboxylase protein C n=1 Tax=Klebsiella pneumoniae TaxID=573 RepID=A0A378ABC0_KLEPN|nr:hydroxyaromatic non-oxidative decarboxylase protein C [Klebsiella pneumoniae]